MPEFAPELITKHNVNGARYTSYPTANLFHDTDSTKYIGQLGKVPRENPLSLYLYVPFCANVCYYFACNKIYTGNRKHAEAYIDHLVTEVQMQT